MTNGHSQSAWRTELLSALDQLSSLRDDLRSSESPIEPDLLMETVELVAKAERAVFELTRTNPGVDVDAVRDLGNRGIDFLTIASTVGITTVLLPFLQSLVQNAGNDVYKALTKLVRSKTRHSDQRDDPERIVLDDKQSEVRVIIDSSVDRAAVDSLREIDLTDPAMRHTVLRWNADKGQWLPDSTTQPVSFWLPGDPLDVRDGAP
ncbi:hypothetical protein [Actinophytocola xanthii]|uniref:Uncharacterized protein n=1 Tax=Actinophytocola xanthii TaxID=1912961 RepID=A0A1Q8CAH5_9PSEU|nr:hypothetical protein [Actinophytocola xanthii]OLF11340.1 hypothetical protein BU204_30465 [Actinophytocola xanthii]